MMSWSLYGIQAIEKRGVLRHNWHVPQTKQGCYAVSDERITKLETYREVDIATIQGFEQKLDAIGADVNTIKLALEKQKGFLSGAMFVLLPISSAFTIAAASLWDRLTGQ